MAFTSIDAVFLVLRQVRHVSEYTMSSLPVEQTISEGVQYWHA
jgi:hypothetical protein